MKVIAGNSSAAAVASALVLFRVVRYIAGAVSGIMTTTAGVGGPAMSVYAVASKWDQRSFAASMQPYFLTIGLAAILAKYVATPESMPALEPSAWAVVVLAYSGACAATGRGIAELAG